MKQKFLIIILSLFLSLAFTGCSNGKIELSYEPSLKTEKCNHLVIQVTALVEASEAINSKESKGMQVGIIEFEDFSNWVLNAFKLELQQAGYTVPSAHEPFEYEVCYGPLNFEDQAMEIELFLKKGDDLIFSKCYRSRKPLEIKLYRLLFGVKSAISKGFNQSLQDVCEQFIADLNQELL